MAELRAYNPTFRERSTQYVANLLRDKFGMDNYRSYDLARDIFGDESSPTMLGSMGIADFTPFGAVYGGQEGVRMYQRSDDLVGKGLGGLTVGLSALEGLGPLGFAVKSAKKALPKAVKPDNPDLQRRAVVKGLAALPVATTAIAKGIDSIPLGKLAKGVRPLPDAVTKLAPGFRSKILEGLPSWTNTGAADTVVKTIGESPTIQTSLVRDLPPGVTERDVAVYESMGIPPEGYTKESFDDAMLETYDTAYIELSPQQTPMSFQANYVQDQIYFLDSMRETMQTIPERFKFINGERIATAKQTTPMKELYPTKESFFEDLNKGIGLDEKDLADEMDKYSADLIWDFIQKNGDLSLGDAIQVLNGERKKLLENPELVAELVEYAPNAFKDPKNLSNTRANNANYLRVDSKKAMDHKKTMFADDATFGVRGEDTYGSLAKDPLFKIMDTTGIE